MRLVKKKNHIRLKCNKHPLNLKLRNYYLKLCDQLKTLIPVIRDEFFFDELRKNSGNLGGEWKVVNKILNRKQVDHAPVLLSVNNVDIHNSSEISDIFNDFFSSLPDNFILPNSDAHSCPCSVLVEDIFQQKRFLLY